MQLFIDDACPQAIRRCLDKFPCDGVTTNPSILKRTGQPPYLLLNELRAMLPEKSSLHVQVISVTAEEMLEEARTIRQRIGGNTYIKVPATEEGVCAIRMMAAEGIPVTATAIYTPMQALLAAKAGAEYAAPYVNRLDNMGMDGLRVARTIHDIFTVHNMNCKVLAASFKNTMQIQELCAYGIGSVTAAPELIEQMLRHPAVGPAVDAFNGDFHVLCGQGRTMQTV